MPGNVIRLAPPGSRELLARILEQPSLVAAVQALPAAALGRLINHVGLEDAGEIVALATTEQLRHVFDDDLWRSERPGQDESFDADRFALWLEIMLEAGEETAAQRLVELPEDLVTLALGRHVLVVNIEEMAVAMSNRRSDDDALLEKALESCLCEEIGEYRIIARRHDGWDAILLVLLALDRDHHDFLARVLERCCYAAAEQIEQDGGLYRVLTSEEMLEVDAAAEREDRRAEEGYLAPSSAASFLALARTTELAEIEKAKERDPISKAYFRSLRPPAARLRGTGEASAAQTDNARTAAPLVDLLREAEVLPSARARALLEASGARAHGEGEGMLRQAMRRLAERAADEHAQRMAELAFLANVLQAGCSVGGRGLRPAEAASAAVAVCNLALEYQVKREGKTAAAALAQGADKLFRIGWRLLAQEVADPAAQELQAMLARAQGRSADPALVRASAALQAARAAGKPWTARSQLGVAAEVLGEGTLRALLGLLDQCPRLDGAAPGAQVAGEGELAFISTLRHLRAVKLYLARLRRSEGR
jgi:hypothetical protein